MRKKTQLTAPATPVGDILTEDQTAALLAVETRTLRLWRKTRGLPHVKLTSKIIRYRRADIDQWLARHRVAMIAA